MLLGKIETIKSLVSHLTDLAANGEHVVDSETICEFSVPVPIFEKHESALNRDLDELDLNDYLRADPDAHNYHVNFNKQELIDNGIVFFVDQQRYQAWLSNIHPFESQSFFNLNGVVKTVIVPGLQKEYSGPKINILSTASVPAAPIVFEVGAFDNLPVNTKIREQVHIISSGVVIEPLNYVLNNPELNQDVSPFVRYAIMSLAACLIQEIRSADVITIRGLKRIELTLSHPADFDGNLLELMKLLVKCVSWVNEEKSETRTKLISDRLSLDMSADQTFIFGINKYLEHALVEAKEKYGFIISEKSDEYHKERRAIQVEINKQLQSYAEKTRTLISTFLRDTLAGLFLVGFSIFGPTKPSDIPKILSNPYIGILFKGLGVYFVISLVVQAWVNITDVIQSRKELIRFTAETRNYMREEEVTKFIKDSLKSRETFFWISSAVLAFVYLIVILFCCFFPYLVNSVQYVPPIN
jgi:hypothetical protein